MDSETDAERVARKIPLIVPGAADAWGRILIVACPQEEFSEACDVVAERSAEEIDTLEAKLSLYLKTFLRDRTAEEATSDPDFATTLTLYYAIDAWRRHCALPDNVRA